MAQHGVLRDPNVNQLLDVEDVTPGRWHDEWGEGTVQVATDQDDRGTRPAGAKDMKKLCKLVATILEIIFIFRIIISIRTKLPPTEIIDDEQEAAGGEELLGGASDGVPVLQDAVLLRHPFDELRWQVVVFVGFRRAVAGRPFDPASEVEAGGDPWMRRRRLPLDGMDPPLLQDRHHALHLLHPPDLHRV
uniref:Uncharacterized protein n=1 Tax=Oryza punctata TaxID=4537 RepID=A0A0E0L6A0_ORYPU